MTDDVDRQRLRSRLRDQRRRIAPAQRLHAADALAVQLQRLPFSQEPGYVAGYWALDGEIALHAWQLRLPASQVYCLPVLHGDVLAFAPWRPGDPLTSNRYGIPEPDLDAASLLAPSQMQWVVVPLVAFDNTGTRLGMGGGWYDRSFEFRSHTGAPPRLVGAGFATQQVEHLPRQPWDVPLDAVCTEAATFVISQVETA